MEKQYPKNLEKWGRFWEKEKIYKFKRDKKSIYSIDTPPPYVSAEHLHVGHVMSYVQADFIARFWRQKGFNVFYPMGFDDNGLPTERFVEKKYNIDKSKISKKNFVELCLKETRRISKIYKKFWQKIGLSIDWSLSYNTIGPLCQKISQKSFIELFKNKKIIRREEPIIWCPKCQTALSQADLIDKKESGYLNFIKFLFWNGKEAIVATTRPELIPACIALFVNPLDKRYKAFIGKKAIVPLGNYKVPILASQKVDQKFGTGLMMVCTWGDIEDIYKWKQYKLKTRLIINKDGSLNELSGVYKGLSIMEARKKILIDLEKNGFLKKKEKITHVLNVHERCKTPIEFLKAPQWFIKILDIKKTLKKQGKKINWYPKFMKVKYDNWVDNLKWDWCISRQRFYGTPFPVWYCSNCGKIILAKEKDLPVDPTQNKPPISRCPKCKSNKFLPETDVMDTWMTSSLTPLINARWKEKKSLIQKIYPMNLRPQGFEIIRSWLFYTVVKSFFHTKTLPWKNVMISGWGLDWEGKKMSKSLGNVIYPEEVLKKYPVDALRYWATKANLGKNLRYQEKEVENGHRLMTKLWNAFYFSFFHLKNFNINNFNYNFKLYPTDQWIFSKLQETIKKSTNYFEKYEYGKARREIEDFFWKDFCNNYLELIKYRLYSKREDIIKKSAQFTLYKVFLNILKLFAPFLPYLTEEIYQLYFRKLEKVKSIHLTSWPVIEKDLLNKKIELTGDRIINLINAIRKSKSERNYSLKEEVKRLIIYCSNDMAKKLSLFVNDLKEMNNINVIEFKTKDEIKNGISVRDGLKIKIQF
ncbi:MAG: valine--tRNA ligase [Patescibacteria group bacterium]|nr:valine--tRNA ligase [Patescibacteria group bacterium]